MRIMEWAKELQMATEVRIHESKTESAAQLRRAICLFISVTSNASMHFVS